MRERPELTATYRVQMNAGFTFAHARARVEYFARLGISHLYCSPILAARHGSMHGYDVVDPMRINAEIGTEPELRALVADLHARGMGLVLDIVPNHMGIGAANPYWDDVLAHGERSRYARWFDIDWSRHPGGHRKVVLPVLGDELDSVLGRGELSVRLHEERGGGETPRVVYFDQSFPIEPASLPPELQLVTFDPEETSELAELFSGKAGRDRLRGLLAAQHYQLTSWKCAASEINYRRFFDVNDLVALRMHDPEVFRESHALMLRFVREGVVDGLRIDHIDGLRDPRGYLVQLREAVGSDVVILIEKILSPGEMLRTSWPVEGTTGYEFLNDLEDVYLDPAGYDEIERCYRRLRRLGTETFHDMVIEAKTQVLEGSLAAEVGRLAEHLAPMARAAGKSFRTDHLEAGIVAFVASLGVYRTYLDDRVPVEDADRTTVVAAANDARARCRDVADVVAFISDVLLGILSPIDADDRLRFTQRLQQLSGPAAAKGVEDTALYVYVPLVSRNEVGGAPDRPLDDAMGRLHRANGRRAETWPRALVCTDTHDTKRSADVRSRLDALTEVPQEWERAIRRWRRLNAKHRRTVKGRMAPDTNSEYLVYQTLVALWPPPRAGRRSDDLPDRAWREAARTRVSRYMRKAAREAKIRTSWVDPDAGYERALDDFVAAILEPREDAPFLTDVARLVSRVAPMAAWNALSRIVIHLTAPGTPDVYQGDELWNFTLVDPDNRRPVDYDARSTMLGSGTLAELEERLHDAGATHADPFDARLKLLVTQRLLELRRNHAHLFAHGGYHRLEVRGARAQHIVAFSRHDTGGRLVLTLAPRLICTLLPADPAAWWSDTVVELPRDLRGRHWHSQIVSGNITANDDTLALAPILRALPMAVLVS